MIPESFKCRLISWDEAYQLSRSLAAAIKSSGLHPDLVVAIGRGGYVPARVVCDLLLHNLLTSIKVEHWAAAASKLERAVVRFPIAADVEGLRLLVIDDVTDTGDTLAAAVSYLEGLGAGEISTGVLQHKTTSSFQPDYWGEVVTEWMWIIYPWASHEDLTGFVERVLSEGPLSKERLRAELERRYFLSLDEARISEILAELVERGRAEVAGPVFRRPKR